MKYDIFISYKRKSLATANNLYYRLTTRGYSTFFDLEEMRRDNFNTQLLHYIENAKDVFVILEEGSLDACKKDNWEDDWFCMEIAYALKTKRNIIPILIGDYKMPRQEFFPKELQELSLKNAPEFSFSYFEEYLNKLIEKGYITSEAEIKNQATSIFKFYSNENCQVFKEGKLVCSLEGLSDEPYYLPVSRKGDYRFKCINSITAESQILNEVIDTIEEKSVTLKWNGNKNITIQNIKKSKKKIWLIIGICATSLSLLFISSCLLFLLHSNRYSIWKKRIDLRKYQTIDYYDISHGKLYGNHEAVDLGLSVKWATCNIGADYPHNYGDFFSWGETKTKQDYSWNKYKYTIGDSLIKYCTDLQYGKVDSLSVLCSSDDAASVLWGNGWRMPTLEETEELLTKCTFELKVCYGVLGFVAIGPNGKTLFLPLAGDISDNNTNIQGKDAYVIFWTANLHADNRKAYEFAMSHLNNYWYSSERNTGHNIRAVHK